MIAARSVTRKVITSRSQPQMRRGLARHRRRRRNVPEHRAAARRRRTLMLVIDGSDHRPHGSMATPPRLSRRLMRFLPVTGSASARGQKIERHYVAPWSDARRTRDQAESAQAHVRRTGQRAWRLPMRAGHRRPSRRRHRGFTARNRSSSRAARRARAGDRACCLGCKSVLYTSSPGQEVLPTRPGWGAQLLTQNRAHDVDARRVSPHSTGGAK